MILFSLARDGAGSQRQSCLTASSRSLISWQALYQNESRKRPLARGWWWSQGFVISILIILSIKHWTAPFLCDLPPMSKSAHWKHCENIPQAQFRDRGTANLTCSTQAQEILNTVMKHQKQSSNRQQYYKGRSKINREAPPRIPQSVPLNSQAAGTRSNVENIQRPPVLTDDVSRFQELPTSTALDVYLDKQQLQTILNIQPPCSHCWNKRETEEETWPSTFIAAEEGREEKAQRNPTRTFLP